MDGASRMRVGWLVTPTSFSAQTLRRGRQDFRDPKVIVMVVSVIDTRQLDMFARVVEAGSFSAAARALHCSQPAISQQMRALERSLGGPLFLRVGRGLQLTEAGRVLAQRCRAILDDLAVTRQ